MAEFRSSDILVYRGGHFMLTSPEKVWSDTKFLLTKNYFEIIVLVAKITSFTSKSLQSLSFPE